MAAEETRHRRVEVVATVLLAAAAIGTAWSTYQATRWRGEQASQTAKATAARIESSSAATHAGQQTEIDIATFTQWSNATLDGDTKRADFYQTRFRSELQPAFDAWFAKDPLTNPDAPLTPFELPEYKLAATKQAEELNRQAGAHSNEASDANQNADSYMLAVVLFAVCLFFAGISTKLGAVRQREILLGLGAVIFISSAIWVVTLPISTH